MGVNVYILFAYRTQVCLHNSVSVVSEKDKTIKKYFTLKDQIKCMRFMLFHFFSSKQSQSLEDLLQKLHLKAKIQGVFWE